jgi:hypothetical protein
MLASFRLAEPVSQDMPAGTASAATLDRKGAVTCVATAPVALGSSGLLDAKKKGANVSDG